MKQPTMLQNHQEIDWLIELLLQADVKSYLEIGCRFGGSLWRVANALPKGSRIVAVDLPAAADIKTSLKECVAELRQRGYDAQLILGDSRDDDVIAAAQRLGPYDACLIDANHTTPYIKSDWQHYGSISSIVAFHDIAWKRDGSWTGARIEVPEFWNQVKNDFPHQEIMLDRKDNGIGVLWR